MGAEVDDALAGGQKLRDRGIDLALQDLLEGEKVGAAGPDLDPARRGSLQSRSDGGGGGDASPVREFAGDDQSHGRRNRHRWVKSIVEPVPPAEPALGFPS